jgi:hypothetical protein
MKSFIIVIFAAFMLFQSCRYAEKPTEISDMQTLGGLKLGAPAPNSCLLDYPMKLPIELNENQRPFPEEQIRYFFPCYYGDLFFRKALSAVFEIHPDRMEGSPITASIVFSYGFYLENTNVGIAIEADGKLYKEGISNPLFAKIYTVKTNIPFAADDSELPSAEDMIFLLETALFEIGKHFENEPRWRYKY